MKGVAVADNHWVESDWESVWTELNFDLSKGDGNDNLINDGCDSHDGDNFVDDCGS